MTGAGKHRDQRRRALEQIREDESLTADLADKAAEILLDWSTGQVEAAFRGTEALSPGELDVRVAVLRRLLKRISRQAGQAAPDRQPQRVRSLLSSMESRPGREGEAPPGRTPA